MPVSVVKSLQDEKDWEKAKELAQESGHKENYAYVMGIFQRITKTRNAREYLQQSCWLDAREVLRWKDGGAPVPISVMRKAGVIPSGNQPRD